MDDQADKRVQRDEHGRLHYQPSAGDVVVLRKAHVCGSDRMVITGVGLDVRLSCSGCGAHVTLTRERLRSRLRDVAGTIGDGSAG
jgi:hypothetical protein